MENLRRKYTPSFKAKVALEAIKEHRTAEELSSQYRVHHGQIRNWKATATMEQVWHTACAKVGEDL